LSLFEVVMMAKQHGSNEKENCEKA